MTSTFDLLTQKTCRRNACC